MIRKVTIENFKSIEKLELELGRVNVLIGENGGGKSNILEGIAFAAAATQDKLDNEFLAPRGIRVTESRFMRAAFDPEHEQEQHIRLVLEGDGVPLAECLVKAEHGPTMSRWVVTDAIREKANKIFVEALTPLLSERVKSLNLAWEEVVGTLLAELYKSPEHMRDLKSIPGVTDLEEYLADKERARSFLIYAPENTALRNFQVEGQILPLGTKGEGLFSHIRALATSEEHRDKVEEIIDKLSLVDWFERFEIPEDLFAGERRIRIRDRYLAEGALFDQRSANEGFLFLLFYFTLLVSPDAPRFFAIDNIDTSLNPKLCSALIRELVDLAKNYDKQAILTTHNPAILDGLDLHDDEQRLFVVSRNQHGHTKAHRISPPQSVDGRPTTKLSNAFLNGYIGGLPKNF